MFGTSRRLLAGTVIAAAMCASAFPAYAAGEADWAAFRLDVEAKCLAAAEPLFETAEAIVDPFGSQTYGLALIRGKARGADVSIMAICVYDKQTKTAEIGGELPDMAAPIAPVQTGGVAWTDMMAECGEACAPLLGRLSTADAAALMGLAERVNTTVAAIGGDGALPSDGAAIGALARIEAVGPGGALDRIPTGERACTVYWYGFLDRAAQTVGQHRCLVERTDTGLTVTKLTGEMLRADILPAGQARIVIGRTYLADQAERAYDPENPDNAANPNFGNYAGLAFVDDEGLLIVDADLHGFDTPDPTFFAVLAVQ